MPTFYRLLRRAKSARRLARQTSRGFTMMELLVVLAILGLLAGIAIHNVTGIHAQAESQTARLFVRDSMKTALFTYKMNMGDYPSTAEGLGALLNAPANKSANWHGPYIEGGRVPIDPWGEPYQYEYPGKHAKMGQPYDLWSKGPDKQPGTEDDIGNWDAPAAGDQK